MNDRAEPYARIIFLLSAAFCAYEFILRVKLSPLSQQILTELVISANGLGFLSSAFFYGYAPVQLLSGPIIQRYGPQNTLTFALAICAIATLFFAVTNSIPLLFLQRFLVGVGAGFAYIGAYILISHWFPSRQWAFLYGMLQFIGCLGAMYGQRLLAFLSITFAWRQLSLILGYVGIMLGFFFIFFLKDKASVHRGSNNKSIIHVLISQLKTVAGNPKSYPIALYAFFAWGPITISATLWGPAFLEKKLMISSPEATYLSSLTWLGIAIGSPLIGFLATRVAEPKRLMLLCAALGAVSSLLLLSNYYFTLTNYKIIIFLIGFSAAAQPISFVKIQQINPPECRGTAVGFNNMAVILSGACLQPLSSYLIGHSDGVILSELQSNMYTMYNYKSGLMLMPICFTMCFALALFFITDNYRECTIPSRMRTKRIIY